MASGFVEYDQVMSYNPTGEELPDTSFFVQFSITCVGNDIPSRRLDSVLWVRIDAGDTLQAVQNKIRDAAQGYATNIGITLPVNQLVIPAYQKG